MVNRTLPRVLGLSLISVLGFGLIAFLTNRRFLDAFDAAVIAFVQGLEAPVLTSFMTFLSFIGSFPMVFVLMLFVMLLQYRVLRHRLELLLLFIIAGGAMLVNTLLKLVFLRERPTLYRLGEAVGYSFPSGHAMSAFALYATLAFLFWRHIPTRRGRTGVILVSIAMILLIGISRIYLGVHYPSDIVGGYFASAFWFTLWVWLFQWYRERRHTDSVRPS